MNSTTEVIKFSYAGTAHERRGETWFRMQAGQAFEVSFQQGEIIELAYQTSLAKGQQAQPEAAEVKAEQADKPAEAPESAPVVPEIPAAEFIPWNTPSVPVYTKGTYNIVHAALMALLDHELLNVALAVDANDEIDHLSVYSTARDILRERGLEELLDMAEDDAFGASPLKDTAHLYTPSATPMRLQDIMPTPADPAHAITCEPPTLDQVKGVLAPVVVEAKSVVCPHCGGRACANGGECETCKGESLVLPATAREYADELKAAEPLTAGALYADLQAEMAELKAENIRLTMASRQRETEVAFLADHVDELEKQIGNLDARRARLVRKAGEYHKSLWARRELFTVLDTAHNDTLRQLAKAEKIASESRAHVRALKTENRELRESLDAARAHVELLQKQIPVAAIIETREQPAPVEPPKTLPFDASQQTAATPESKG